MTKGRYIPRIQREAMFASMLLPQAERDELRARKAMASEVLTRFELHHITYFAWGQENSWWNLHPMPKAEHRERTRDDLRLIAKAKRIRREQEEHDAAMLTKARPGRAGRGSARRGKAGRGLARRGEAGQGVARQGKAWQGKARKIPSRPFPKRVK